MYFLEVNFFIAWIIDLTTSNMVILCHYMIKKNNNSKSIKFL
jgi:hypothetical protein